MRADNFAEAIRLAVAHSGRAVLADAPVLLALLGDYAPHLKDERAALRTAFALQIPARLAAAVNQPPHEQEALCVRCAALLGGTGIAEAGTAAAGAMTTAAGVRKVVVGAGTADTVLRAYATELGYTALKPLPSAAASAGSSAPAAGGLGRTVFACWAADGCFYPAVVRETVGDGHVRITFMDGTADLVAVGDIIEKEEALSAAKLWADWERRGFYYPCRLKSRVGEPLVVRYKADGVSERVDLAQLRCTLKMAAKIKRLWQKNTKNTRRNHHAPSTDETPL